MSGPSPPSNLPHDARPSTQRCNTNAKRRSNQLRAAPSPHSPHPPAPAPSTANAVLQPRKQRRCKRARRGRSSASPARRGRPQRTGVQAPSPCSLAQPLPLRAAPAPAPCPAHPAHAIGEPAQQAPTVWPCQLLLRCEARYRPASSARSPAVPGRRRQNLSPPPRKVSSATSISVHACG
jgi:hypothetical protein